MGGGETKQQHYLKNCGYGLIVRFSRDEKRKKQTHRE